MKKGHGLRVGGFTLVEMAVAIGIFGIVATVLTNIILKVILESNRSLTQNEIRQNAERVMADIGSEIRKASCVKFVSPTLTTYSDKGCSVANLIATYTVSATPNFKLTKSVVGGPALDLLSEATIATDCPAASKCSMTLTGCTSGLVVSGAGTGATAVSLTIQQKPKSVRTDFCGQVKLTDTFTPRN